MSTLLHLAGPGDIERLTPMVAACHAAEGIEQTEALRRKALLPLLQGSPHGAVWLIGPKIAPVGYVIITFGWSVENGGLDGMIDAIFIRDKVRGRGMGSEALMALMKTLAETDMRGLHLGLRGGNEAAQRFFTRLGFRPRPDYRRMSRMLNE